MDSFAPSAYRVSAYVPCYNNSETILGSIRGIQLQSYPVDEIFVVDDGSTDNSVQLVENSGIRVICMGKNQGRGAVRARAMEMAQNEFVLCCDATNQLDANFLEIALKSFSNEDVVGVYGRWFDPNVRNVVDRWRARHLFKQNIIERIEYRKTLATHGAVLRKCVTLKVGNYNSTLRHGEDSELGTRLGNLGDIVYNPALKVRPLASNGLFKVMERFARWNRASIEVYTLWDFLQSHIVAWRILIPEDLKEKDLPSACISALMPYFALAFADQKSLETSTIRNIN